MSTRKGVKLRATVEKRLKAEEKRIAKLSLYKTDKAKDLFDKQRQLHQAEIALSRISEKGDKRVKSPAKLKERKATRAKIKRESAPLATAVRKLAKLLEANDKKLENARSVVAEITAKPIRERRIRGIRYRANDNRVFFIGGRRDGDVDQGQDYAFRVADLMRSRSVVTDKRYDLPQRIQKGKRKGQLKYKGWSGGLLERNLKIFSKIAGKEIDLHVSGAVYIDGEEAPFHLSRRITPLTYDDIVRSALDIVRSLFKEYGSLVTYTISEISYSPIAAKRTRSKRNGTKKAGARQGRVPSKRTPRKAKKSSKKNVGNRSKRKHNTKRAKPANKVRR